MQPLRHAVACWQIWNSGHEMQDHRHKTHHFLRSGLHPFESSILTSSNPKADQKWLPIDALQSRQNRHNMKGCDCSMHYVSRSRRRDDLCIVTIATPLV